MMPTSFLARWFLAGLLKLGLGRRESLVPSDDDELIERWQDRKSGLMGSMLGQKCHAGFHAIIPYAVGGGLDTYYYPFGPGGTAVATKELSELPGKGSANDVYQAYELVMFTRHSLNAAEAEDTVSGRVRRDIHAILNIIARYSADAVLNPGETCQLPAEYPDVGGSCLLLDGYASRSDDMVEDFGLLAIIGVFRSEMEYSRQNRGTELLERLKANGHYPYSDLERDPVA